MLWAAPLAARAGLSADALEITMYGRAGVAWSPVNGKIIQGTSMNLTGSPLGGRFEEGDYLEPGVKLHLIRPKAEEPDSPWLHAGLTASIFPRSGSFISSITANNDGETLGVELVQLYVEAGNVIIPKLTVWAGARFYRGTDVHIADIYYFNNLSGQGGGVKYGPADFAVLLQTAGSGGLYNWDSDGDGRLDSRRQRTIFVGQYALPVFQKHTLHFLGEFHLLPKAENLDETEVLKSDFGWVAGVKARMDLSGLSAGSFNELAFRYGSRLANGSRAGSQSWRTFGAPDEEGQYDGASGIEAVEHLLYNVNPLLTLNAYGILHYDQGASESDADKTTDYSMGVRSFLYLHDKFHLINEATFQGRKDGEDPWGTAFKFSIVPTLVPTGVRSAWARPHLRFIYTIAVYDQDSRAKLYAPYQKLFGPKEVGHYLGLRAEWWL